MDKKSIDCVALVAVFLALSAFMLLPPIVAGGALSGREIMEEQRKRHRVQDEEELRSMIMIDAAGRERTRQLSGYVMVTEDDQYKLLLRFESPRDIRNTGLLVWENDTGDADQWLYLPAFRRVKRIPSSGKTNRFMGTDFTYEDLRRESFKLHDYELAGTETWDGREVFIVEARPGTEAVAEDSGYSRRRFWIDKERFTTLKVEYYDKAERLLKIQTNRDFVNLQGTVWAPDEIEMHDVQNNTKTIVTVEERKVNQGLGAHLFTEIELRRRR